MRASRWAALGLLVLAGAACNGSTDDAAGGAAMVSPGHWETLAPMPGPPRLYAGVAAARDRLFVVGGLASGPESHAVTSYDSKTDTWETLDPLPAPFAMANVAGVGSKLYVLGGLEVTDVLEYDLDTRRWTARASVPVTRGRGAAAVAVDGTRILVAGGVIAGQSANMLNTGVRQKDFLAYDTVADSWQKLPDLELPRGYAAGAVTGNLFWVLGGSTDFVRTDQRDAFDLKAGQWTDKPPLPVTLSSLAAATLGGRVYVIGGIATSTGMITSETRVLDPVTASLVSVAPMKTPRFAMGAAAMGGRIYVPGGAALINPPSGFGPTDVLEVYIP